jgi:hypothetical protein
LRKYLIVALAAVLSIAVASVALAANAAPDVTAKLTPTKAGTKKKPKNATLKLFVKNNQNDATVDTITVNIGKQVKLSGKGFPYCTAATLDSQSHAGCKPGSKVGGGTAHAVAGPGHAPVTFTVTAYVGSATSVIFYVEQNGGTIRQALTGKISRGSGKFGQKIVITIPPQLQEAVPGLFSSLVDLRTTLQGKKGKHYLISSIGCKKKKHDMGVKFNFNPNATFPATGSTAGTTKVACKK